jgi:proline iminopeptidase
VLVAASLIWGDEKKNNSDIFFLKNGKNFSKNLLTKDSKKIEKIANERTPSFIEKYNAKRSLFFRNPTRSFWNFLWSEVSLNETLTLQYFKCIEHYDIRKRLNSDVAEQMLPPVFLMLGLYDSSVPVYTWTVDLKAILEKEKIEYIIFEKSGHYPMMEEPTLFVEKLIGFVNHLNLAEPEPHIRAKL